MEPTPDSWLPGFNYDTLLVVLQRVSLIDIMRVGCVSREAHKCIAYLSGRILARHPLMNERKLRRFRCSYVDTPALVLQAAALLTRKDAVAIRTSIINTIASRRSDALVSDIIVAWQVQQRIKSRCNDGPTQREVSLWMHMYDRDMPSSVSLKQFDTDTVAEALLIHCRNDEIVQKLFAKVNIDMPVYVLGYIFSKFLSKNDFSDNIKTVLNLMTSKNHFETVREFMRNHVPAIFHVKNAIPFVAHLLKNLPSALQLSDIFKDNWRLGDMYSDLNVSIDAYDAIIDMVQFADTDDGLMEDARWLYLIAGGQIVYMCLMSSLTFGLSSAAVNDAFIRASPLILRYERIWNIRERLLRALCGRLQTLDVNCDKLVLWWENVKFRKTNK